MRPSLVVRRAAGAVALAMSLAACASSPASTTEAVPATSEVPVATAALSGGGSGSSGAIDVCALLTDAQIEEVTGLAVASKEPGGGQGFATGACTWILDSGAAEAGLDRFSVTVESPGGRSRFDILAGEMPHVPSIGEDAYLQGESIWVVSGDSLVVVDFAFLASVLDDPGQAVLPLIETILSQL